MTCSIEFQGIVPGSMLNIGPMWPVEERSQLLFSTVVNDQDPVTAYGLPATTHLQISIVHPLYEDQENYESFSPGAHVYVILQTERDQVSRARVGDPHGRTQPRPMTGYQHPRRRTPADQMGSTSGGFPPKPPKPVVMPVPTGKRLIQI